MLEPVDAKLKCDGRGDERPLFLAEGVRYETANQDTVAWLIREFTELRGGCIVLENTGGYYLSETNQIKDDRVSVVYSDFPMNWGRRSDRREAKGVSIDDNVD